MELEVEPRPGGTEDIRVRVRLAERDGVPVHLKAMSWEPLVPTADARSAAFRRGGLDEPGLALALGSSSLPGRGRLEAKSVALPGVRRTDGPLVFKVVGTDPDGRRVAAWAEVTFAKDDDEAVASGR
jgi:hypothetical protein